MNAALPTPAPADERWAPANGIRVTLFDTTLRDGAQSTGVKFTVADKIAIAHALDELGIDYVEGGWPGANPTDDAFFGADAPTLQQATFTAFGMTRRAGRSASNDPGLAALVSSKARALCLVGKTWDLHVDLALGISNKENLDYIRDSIAHCRDHKGQALFDCEHFFDGYKANPDYAIACTQAALEGGADWVVLCDTNGGTLPGEIHDIVTAIRRYIPPERLGIHTHNDTENAVANTLVAVDAGARMVQGTLNGLGERCGNANLCSLIPTLAIKRGYELGLADGALERLVSVSRLLDDRLNQTPDRHRPYVGESAFAHKGGLHVSAVAKSPRSYEHIHPRWVGNERQTVVSNQAGRSNVLQAFGRVGIDVDPQDQGVAALLDDIKRREDAGYAYEDALASFELLARRTLGKRPGLGIAPVPSFFELTSFRVIDEHRQNARGEPVTMSEATVKIRLGGAVHMTVAEGNGPVNALDRAMRKVLLGAYPALESMRLVDYKVRILSPQDATEAVTRVMIESADDSGERWVTIGVGPNIIHASYDALHEAITWRLMRAQFSQC